jgi:hypothetical protein
VPGSGPARLTPEAEQALEVRCGTGYFCAQTGERIIGLFEKPLNLISLRALIS